MTAVASVQNARDRVGAVAIGRNEGERLRTCLESLQRDLDHVVYVDSGSTDQSLEIAASFGIPVVELDTSIPFSAARARNEGIARLLHDDDSLEFVQVIDGDCELREGWIDAALETFQSHESAAVVCGRRRERNPDASVFQRIIDMEWNTPIGEAAACGGDALIRVAAFDEVGGYDAGVIAGEEPEMCLRVRRAGYTVHRIDQEMTWHDAQVAHCSQWWRRAARNGYAYGVGWSMHGSGAERYRVREVQSILIWALFLPLVAFGLAWWTFGFSMSLLLGYAALWWRVRNHRLQRGDAPEHAALYARYVVLGKFAELTGLARFCWRRLRSRQDTILEYRQNPEKNEAPAMAEAGGP